VVGYTLVTMNKKNWTNVQLCHTVVGYTLVTMNDDKITVFVYLVSAPRKHIVKHCPYTKATLTICNQQAMQMFLFLNFLRQSVYRSYVCITAKTISKQILKFYALS